MFLASSGGCPEPKGDVLVYVQIHQAVVAEHEMFHEAGCIGQSPHLLAFIHRTATPNLASLLVYAQASHNFRDEASASHGRRVRDEGRSQAVVYVYIWSGEDRGALTSLNAARIPSCLTHYSYYFHHGHD